MKTQLIILEQCNIIVSDNLSQKGQFCYDRTDKDIFVKTYTAETHPLTYERPVNEWDYQPIIASDNPKHNLPNIDYNGLKEKLGIVHWSKYWEIVNQQLYEQGGVNPHPYRLGFKDAQSLNKRFSLEDINKIKDILSSSNLTDKMRVIHARKHIQSLQQPKLFDVEIEMERYYADEVELGKGKNDGENIELLWIPKITNNLIKITKIL